MTCKVSLTTHCNGRCVTCPVWQYPGEHMSVETWRVLWARLNASELVRKVILNGTGDVGAHPKRDSIFEVMLGGKRPGLWLTLQTNAAHLPDLPPGLNELVISFNGGTRESYERTTGLPFDQVVANVKALYPQIMLVPSREIHCLIYDGNAGTEEALADLWHDFPGRVRVGYKYDNQHDQDRTLDRYRAAERIPCDYLDQLVVWPDGSVVQCAHDFEGSVRWGSLLDATPEELMQHHGRQAKRVEHACGEYTGLCADCNYNVPIRDQFRYLEVRR